MRVLQYFPAIEDPSSRKSLHEVRVNRGGVCKGDEATRMMRVTVGSHNSGVARPCCAL